MKPYRFVREYQPQPPYPTKNRVRFLLTLHAPLSPPGELPVLIGDCLTNLRASLDHLVYGIAMKYTNSSSTEDLAKQTSLQFPIYDDAKRFSAWRGKVVRFLSPDVLAVLESFQPYQGWDGVVARLERHLSKNPRWVLNALVNADKHRALMPVTQLRFSNVRFAAKIPGEGSEASGYISGSYKHRDTIIDFHFYPESPNAEVTVGDDFTEDVAFSEEWPAANRPVSLLLHGLADNIRDFVFPELEPFL
jgi:hypothetical protein